MNRIEGDLTVTGRIVVGDMALPAESFGDTEFGTDDPLTTEKQYHRIYAVYGQDYGAVVAAKRRMVHIAKSAGVIESLQISLISPCTGTTSYVKCHLKKNGSNVTSTQAQHNPAHAAYETGIDGAFSSASYVAGDKFEFDVSVSAGDGAIGQGLALVLILNEEP